MTLTKEEAAALKKLQDKAKEPDTPAPSVNYNLDLSDDKAYERAVKLGLVNEPGDNGSDDDDDSDDDADADDVPKRRSYFGD